MKSWLQTLDRILRGEMTKGAKLEQGLAAIPLGGMTVLIILLGIIYGMGMGTFSLFKAGGPSVAQFFSSALKIPALFLLTLVVTFPSLYVFNALVGSRLTLLPVLRLLIAGLAVTLTVVASFGPIVAFFSISTTSYSFMVLLNVLMCAVAGVLGLAFLRQTLHRLTITARVTPQPASPPAAEPTPAPLAPQAVGFGEALPPPPPIPAPVARRAAPGPGALDPLDDRPLGLHVRTVFRCWMVLFALVGSQMGWVLRPFIGNPDAPFVLFRGRDSNFFAAVWGHFIHLFQ